MAKTWQPTVGIIFLLLQLQTQDTRWRYSVHSLYFTFINFTAMLYTHCAKIQFTSPVIS